MANFSPFKLFVHDQFSGCDLVNFVSMELWHIQESTWFLPTFYDQPYVSIPTLLHTNVSVWLYYLTELDGVGPVDNRPSTNKLHQIVQKKKNVTCDTWHVTCDTWHMTRGTWHVTHDMLGVMNILSKFQFPSPYCLWIMMLWRYGGKGSMIESINESINESVTRLFIEQPRLHRVC